MHTIYINIDFGFVGELGCLIAFDYQPKERATLEEPGCDESIEITSIQYNGIELRGLFNEAELEELEERVLVVLNEDE